MAAIGQDQPSDRVTKAVRALHLLATAAQSATMPCFLHPIEANQRVFRTCEGQYRQLRMCKPTFLASKAGMLIIPSAGFPIPQIPLDLSLSPPFS
jgi:hypothetical protein